MPDGTTLTDPEVAAVFARNVAGRDYWKGVDRERYLRNPSLSPAEIPVPATDDELAAKSEAEVASRRAFQATAAGEFNGAMDRAEETLTQALAAVSMVRSARSRADGEISADVLAKLSAFQTLAATIQAEAILMGTFAAIAGKDAMLVSELKRAGVGQ